MVCSYSFSQTWDGGGADNQWGTATNWVADTVPSSSSSTDISFDGTTQLTNNVNTAWTLRGLVFSNGAGAFVITNSTLTLHGGITNFSPSTQTINNNISMGAAQNWFVSNGSIAYAGVMSGGSAYNQSGTGTVFFLGANTYTGVTTVSNGTLVVSGNGRINHIGQNMNLLNNGTLIVSNGGAVTNNVTTVGEGAGTGGNLLILSGNTVTNRLGDWLDVGRSGANSNTVMISNGATLSVAQGIRIGELGTDNGSSNSVTVSGAQMYLGNSITVARGGTNNNLSILAGSTLIMNNELKIAELSGGRSNSLTVMDSSMQLTNGSLYVGDQGSLNTAFISNSTLNIKAHLYAGNNAAANSNTLIIVDSQVTNGGDYYIGGNGADNNSAYITNSTLHFNSSLSVGNSTAANSNLLVVVGSTILSTNTAFLMVGENAQQKGNKAVFNNSTLSMTNNGQIRIGMVADSDGNSAVFNASTVNLGGDVYVGNGGPNNSLTLNQSTLTSTNAASRNLIVGGGLGANGNTLILSNGSYANFSGDLLVANATGSQGNKVVMSGSTGLFNNVKIGTGHYSDLYVTNGAYLKVTNTLDLGVTPTIGGNNLYLSGSGSTVEANTVLTDNSSPIHHHGGTLTVGVGGMSYLANAGIYNLGDGVQTATLNLAAGSSNNISFLRVTNNGTLNRGIGSKHQGNLDVYSGGTFNFNGAVTNGGNVNFASGSTIDTLQSSDLFRVQGNFINHTTFNIQTPGGSSTPSFAGIEIAGVGTTFTNNGTINFDFTTAMGGGAGTFSAPYHFGLKGTENIFSNYFSGTQGGQGAWAVNFTFNNWGGATDGTAGAAGRYVTYYYSAGYYYLAVIPEPGTYALLFVTGILALCIGLRNRVIKSKNE